MTVKCWKSFHCFPVCSLLCFVYETVFFLFPGTGSIHYHYHVHTDYVQGGKAQQVCVSLVLFKTFVALQFIIALVTGVAVRVIALLVLVLFHVGLVLVLCLVLLIPISLLLFFLLFIFPLNVLFSILLTLASKFSSTS